MRVTNVQDEVAWYLIHTTVLRMLKETHEAREYELDGEYCFGSIFTHSVGESSGKSLFVVWQWTEESELVLSGFYGSTYPEDLTKEQMATLTSLGWNVQDSSMKEPCVLVWDGKPIEFGQIASIVVATLRDVYGVKVDWLWKFGPHDLAVEIFTPSCDDILVMVEPLRNRNLDDVLDDELSFLESFETPPWLRPWS